MPNVISLIKRSESPSLLYRIVSAILDADATAALTCTPRTHLFSLLTFPALTTGTNPHPTALERLQESAIEDGDNKLCSSESQADSAHTPSDAILTTPEHPRKLLV